MTEQPVLKEITTYICFVQLESRTGIISVRDSFLLLQWETGTKDRGDLN